MYTVQYMGLRLLCPPTVDRKGVTVIGIIILVMVAALCYGSYRGVRVLSAQVLGAVGMRIGTLLGRGTKDARVYARKGRSMSIRGMRTSRKVASHGATTLRWGIKNVRDGYRATRAPRALLAQNPPHNKQD